MVMKMLRLKKDKGDMMDAGRSRNLWEESVESVVETGVEPKIKEQLKY